jgi:hypothetical protein
MWRHGRWFLLKRFAMNERIVDAPSRRAAKHLRSANNHRAV